MDKAKIIVIEGTDGSGKATQTKLLKERLKKEGKKVFDISFPNYKSKSSALVEMYLSGKLGENPEDTPAKITSMFFALDRYITFKTEIKKYYDDPKYTIILDRYTTANMVHQVIKIEEKEEREKVLEWIEKFEYEELGLPKPDICVFLEVNPNVTDELIKNRKKKEVQGDIHENKNHLEKAYTNGIYVAEKYNWEIINCVKNKKIRSLDDIHNEIYTIIERKIK